MQKLDHTGPSPTLSFLVIFGAALGAAWLLYGLLESSGAIENKGIEIGGAAAGFLVFMWVGHKIFASLTEAWERRYNAAKREAELEQRIVALEAGEVPPIDCPDGFLRHVSRDHGVGFSRPQSWRPHEELFLGIFKRPIDAAAKEIGFLGNIVVTVSPFEAANQLDHPLLIGSLDEKRLRAPILKAALATKIDPETIRWDTTYVQNRKAMRGEFSYIHSESGAVIYSEVITVLDAPREQLFIFALHEAEVRAEASRDAFRRVLSTVRLWEPYGSIQPHG